MSGAVSFQVSSDAGLAAGQVESATLAALPGVLGGEAMQYQIADALYALSTNYTYSVTRRLSNDSNASNGSNGTTAVATASIIWTVEYGMELYRTVMEAAVITSAELAANSTAFLVELSDQLMTVANLSSDAVGSLEVVYFGTVSSILITKTETSTGTTSSFSSTTSKTATSITATSATTTTTTVDPLQLLEAELTWAYTTFVMRFNAGVVFPNPTSSDCTSMFAPLSWVALGRPTDCSFNGDRTIFRAVLGASATVLLGDPVSTLPLTRLGNGAVISEGFTATLNSSEAPISVVASLSSMPQAAQPCNSLTFSGTASGAAGRAFAIAWHFGPRTPAEMVQPLAAALQAANDSQSPLVRFDAADFYTAAQAAMNASSYISGTTLFLELVMEATSWLGSTSSASATVEILQETEPLPTLTANVPRVLTPDFEKDLTISVTTGFVSPSVCTKAAYIRTKPVVLNWEVYGFGGNFAWAPLGGAAGPTDQARSPNVVSFAPFTFDAETDYALRVTAAFQDTTPTALLPEVVFNLSFNPAPPPVAVIAGPTTATSSCAFSLSGAGSYDMGARDLEACVYDYSSLGYADCDAAIASFAAAGQVITCQYLESQVLWFCNGCECAGEEEGLYQTPMVTYAWSCVAVPDGVHSPVCPPLTSAMGASAERLTIDGGLLPPGTYEFHLVVGRSTAVDVSGTAVHTLVVGLYGPPPVEIAVPWSAMDQVSMQVGGFSSTTATLHGGAACPVSTSWFFAWALVSPSEAITVVTPGLNGSNGTSETLQEWSVEMLLDTQVQEADLGALATTTAGGIRDQLTAGQTYSLVLLILPQDSPPPEPVLQGLSTVSAYEALGVSAVFSAAFVADGTPTPGVVAVSPPSGFAVVTSFAISTVAWTDEEPSSLEYAIYRFPQSGPTESWVPPAIDFEDPQSKTYWSKLGGTLMQNFESSAVLTDIVLPTGTFFFLVRARDSLGAVGTATMPGVEVTVSEQELSPSDLSSAFDSAMTSGDPGAILGTLGAVTSATAAGGNETLKQLAVQESLNALTSVVGIFQPDSAGVTQLGSTISSMVSASSGSMSVDNLFAVLNVTSSVIGVVRGVGSSGMDGAGGSAMLSSLSSLNAASSPSSGARWGRTASRSFKEQQALANTAIEVANQLGTAVAEPMTAGTETTLDGTDASGTGAQMGVSKVVSLSAQSSAVSGLSWGGRRLSAPCTDIHIQQTSWIGSNPHAYADPALGEVLPLARGPLNGYVPENATVKILNMEACGEPIEYVNGDARRLLITLTGSSALSVSLTMPSAPGEAEEGYGWDPVCAWFNANTSEWTTEGAEIVGSVNESGGDVTCQASTGGSNMAYTGVWIELLLPTTTTTTTRTTSTTSTTITTSTTTSSWACDPALRPSPYWRAPWNCSWGLDTSTENETGVVVSENYTCVVFCAEGSADTKIVTCDGSAWVVLEECPADVVGDGAGDFGDSATLFMAAGGSFLTVILCAACFVVGYLYYRYQQEQNDKEEALVEHHVPWEEDEPAYEARARPSLRIAAQSEEQDHHFWEWARDWVNHHPTDAQGANLALPALEPMPMPALEGLPPPPRLMIEASPEAQPQLGLPRGASIEEVAVEEDPQFWEWAREWASLRVTTQPEAPPAAPTEAPPSSRAPRF